MSALQRLGRRLARSDSNLVLAATFVPGLGPAIRKAAEQEYRDLAAREREARGITLPAPDRCVWCGAMALRGPDGEIVWAVELSTPDCPGHELLPGAGRASLEELLRDDP